MGNILGKLAEHNAAVISAMTALIVLLYVMYEIKQKKQFRKQIVQALSKKKSDFEDQMNQVYLKDLVDHHEIRNVAEHPIYKIAITGGPCAGKSTSMEKIKQIFT